MPVFESSRKVQKMGSSLAMTLPSLFVKANEIKRGTEVKTFFGLKGILIVCADGEIIKGLDEIINYLEVKCKP